VLQHVSIEVPTGEVDRTIEFWKLLGFASVRPPEPIAEYVTWLERKGTQIHLIHTDQATVPPLGHAAVVAEDFQATFDRLGDAGFEIEESRRLWGKRRAFAIGPGGHRVELMEAPPPRADGVG
jgi:catechol 2,3-dioxygenase-like lactoylglutathione lyase family enzyme